MQKQSRVLFAVRELSPALIDLIRQVYCLGATVILNHCSDAGCVLAAAAATHPTHVFFDLTALEEMKFPKSDIKWYVCTDAGTYYQYKA